MIPHFLSNHPYRQHVLHGAHVVSETIDILYARMIGLVMQCIRAYTDAGAQQVVHDVDVLSKEEHIIEEEIIKPTFKTIQEILKEETHTDVIVTKNIVMYVCSVDVSVYRNPTIEFDGQVGTIPYGEMVMMLEPKGRFFRIAWNALEGWVLREDLVDRGAYVYPEFKIGAENPVDHGNTAHIRAILNDPFGLSRSEFALQAGEYVLYRLWKKGITISWPTIRPRVPGVWHKILRGVPHMHVSVTPKVGSVMEYLFANDTGHLAYVEAVFPDETITISEANYPDFGIYNERELTKEEWKELKPLFMHPE